MGERLHGMQEVIGSIPFTSTSSETDRMFRCQMVESAQKWE